MPGTYLSPAICRHDSAGRGARSAGAPAPQGDVEAREAAGLKQTKLGKALGKSQSFVSNYERGQRRLDVTEFILIARVLGLEPTELLRRLD